MLIGHTDPAAQFRAAVAGGRVHHAWLLAGPWGVGKATFADAAAAWVLARASNSKTAVSIDSFDLDPEHPTARLLAAGSHLDFRKLEVIENTKTGKMRPGIALDQLVKRDTTMGEPLATVLRSTPALGDWRVVIVDSIDDMNRAASNALLKNLEEPPPQTLFLCVSHTPGRLLPTIRSRCRTLRFQLLSDDEVERALRRALPDATASEREALVAIASGSPGRALRFADAGTDKLLGELAALATATPAEATGRALTLAKSLAGKTAAPRYEAFLDLVPAYIAQAAKTRAGPRLARALGLWERATQLGGSAAGLSLDPQSVSFEMAGLVAGLAAA
ncbi:MAG: DNA polymerase III subunit delta' [Pseudomonadota bacterium]|nr:DNA polymerase III subunit delta' [Pseudomonadota bacterium]